MRERCQTCGGYIHRIHEETSGCAENHETHPEEIRHDNPDDAEFCRLITEMQEATR